MSLGALRAHARVTTTDGEVCIWLPSRVPFLAVSGLVLAGSLAMELALLAYARQQGGAGAWAIFTIVTVWLLFSASMVRRRLRAIEQHPTLRLTDDTLFIGSRAVPRAQIRGARFVERATYALVEVDTADGAPIPIDLGSAAQGPPLAALLSAR